jgi:hypothetical protein
MKWRIGLIVVVICVIGIALQKHYAADNAVQSDERIELAPASTNSSPHILVAGEAGQRDRPATFVPITGGKPRARASMDPFFRVPKTRHGLPLEHDPFVAESVEEQRWLDRNGYPNSQQWAAYSTAPEIVLEQAAAHGDSVAEVMLAARQLSHGDPRAGGKLMTAGMNGSSFALHMLASYLISAKHGNPELGYAVSRVVELRGDWRAGITREFGFRVPLTQVQRARAEGKAFQMLDSFRRHSPVYPYVDPRPLPPLSRDEPSKPGRS